MPDRTEFEEPFITCVLNFRASLLSLIISLSDYSNIIIAEVLHKTLFLPD